MGVVELDSGLILGERPLDVPDSGENGYCTIVLAEAEDGEVAAGKLDAALLVDEVDDGTGDLEKGVF